VEVPAGATTDLAGRPNSAASLQMVYQPESNSSVGLGKAIQWMASGSGGTYVAGVLAASMLSPGAACECGSGGWLHVSADGGSPPLSLWTTVERSAHSSQAATDVLLRPLALACSPDRQQLGRNGRQGAGSIPGEGHRVPAGHAALSGNLVGADGLPSQGALPVVANSVVLTLTLRLPTSAAWHAQPAPDARQLPCRLQPAVMDCHGLQVRKPS